MITTIDLIWCQLELPLVDDGGLFRYQSQRRPDRSPSEAMNSNTRGTNNHHPGAATIIKAQSTRSPDIDISEKRSPTPYRQWSSSRTSFITKGIDRLKVYICRVARIRNNSGHDDDNNNNNNINTGNNDDGKGHVQFSDGTCQGLMTSLWERMKNTSSIVYSKKVPISRQPSPSSSRQHILQAGGPYKHHHHHHHNNNTANNSCARAAATTNSSNDGLTLLHSRHQLLDTSNNESRWKARDRQGSCLAIIIGLVAGIMWF